VFSADASVADRLMKENQRAHDAAEHYVSPPSVSFFERTRKDIFFLDPLLQSPAGLIQKGGLFSAPAASTHMPLRRRCTSQ